MTSSISNTFLFKFFLLLSLVSLGYGNSLKKADRYYKNNNTKKAIKYYKKACDEGIEEGCKKYKSFDNPITKAFTLISQSRGEEAMPYLKQACQEGFSWACTMYESATGETITLKKKSNVK